jgi:hypothetical protein
MALLTDDCDIYDIHLMTILGGNGDYYISIIDKKDNTNKTIRISTSGGFAPSRVKIAVAELYRAMEDAGLNEHP